ncbi:DUF3617 domain-containing protein [Sphingorhabdus sp.]|uniref:DUF3617 domain-containing protein n=1 Tax=Sphingorhabdus sp. TaxID=1902408 RepID=UPI003BAF38A6|nr:DUF3617 family protein [Sphingomonadales bacterium]MBK9431317.1 DUF3617 family protein [Sphingomonadales bacterium]
MSFALFRWLPIAFVSIGGCGSGATSELTAAQNANPKPGLWQTTTTLISVVPELQGEAKAAIDKLREPQVESICVSGTVPKIGETAFNLPCRYSKIADEGSRVQREAVCTGQDTVTWTGVRSSNDYDFRIEVKKIDPQSGRTLRTVVTQERGRRLGDC